MVFGSLVIPILVSPGYCGDFAVRFPPFLPPCGVSCVFLGVSCRCWDVHRLYYVGDAVVFACPLAVTDETTETGAAWLLLLLRSACSCAPRPPVWCVGSGWRLCASCTSGPSRGAGRRYYCNAAWLLRCIGPLGPSDHVGRNRTFRSVLGACSDICLACVRWCGTAIRL